MQAEFTRIYASKRVCLECAGSHGARCLQFVAELFSSKGSVN